MIAAATAFVALFALFLLFPVADRTAESNNQSAGTQTREESASGEAQKSVAATDNFPTSLGTSAGKSIVLSSVISPLDPPAKPVREILATYIKKSSPSERDDLEVFSALSYCVNRSFISSNSREAVARGESSQMVEALKREGDNYFELCSGLTTSDFAIRSTIARKRADNGDVDAMLSFRHIGPAGKWPSSGDPPLPAEKMKSWEREVMQYLQSAANKGSSDALLALSDTYLGPGGVPCISDAASKDLASQNYAFASQQNSAMSLAYIYAYQATANLSSSGKATYASVIPRYEACLSPDDQQKARELAERIIRQCCKRS
jgi:hypothetical protein